MRKIVEFTAYGEAVPQGSWNNMGNGRVIQAKRAALHTWRGDVGKAAQAVAPQFKNALIEGPIGIRAVFYTLRPKVKDKKLQAEYDAQTYKMRSPDLDKLCRAIGDALTKIIYRDDDQIVHLEAWDFWTDGSSRVDIEVWELEHKEAPRIKADAPQFSLSFDE